MFILDGVRLLVLHFAALGLVFIPSLVSELLRPVGLSVILQLSDFLFGFYSSPHSVYVASLSGCVTSCL